VHAGLSGDSAAFDARGRQLAWCPSGYRGATVVSVPLGSVNTVYQRLGDWVVALAFAILASAGVLATLRSSTQTASGGVVTKALQTKPTNSHEKR
jgi:apolipoprotein N-acyltransferase